MHIIYFGVMCVGSPLGLRVRDGQKKEKCVTQRRKEKKTNQTYLLFINDNNAHYLFRSDVRGFPFRVKGAGWPKERKMCHAKAQRKKDESGLSTFHK